MKNHTPVRMPHTSTADLLTWSEIPPEDSPDTARSNQPLDRIKKVVFGGQVTDEEVESLNKRQPCSGYKMKEMSGSGIFKANGENGAPQNQDTQTPGGMTGLRMYQELITFPLVKSVSPKKPTALLEVAKQRELTGTIEAESEARLRKQISNAKTRSSVDMIFLLRRRRFNGVPWLLVFWH